MILKSIRNGRRAFDFIKRNEFLTSRNHRQTRVNLSVALPYLREQNKRQRWGPKYYSRTSLKFKKFVKDTNLILLRKKTRSMVR